jgi:hypothetical protein
MPNSNTRSIQVGSVDNTLIATVYNNDGPGSTPGSIKADLAHNTTGISIFVQRIGEDNGSALTLSAKATPATAHADGAFLNLGGGDISVDVPDAPFATYKGRARIYGTFTGGTIIGEWFDVVGFDASVVAVGANTTAPLDATQTQQAAADAITQAGLLTGNLAAGSLAKTVRDSKNADVLFEGQIVTATSNTATLDANATTVCVGQALTIGEEGDIERQTRWVVAFDPATKIVTLDSPWCVVPPDGSDYQIKVLRRSLSQAAVDAISTIDEKIDDLTELDDGDLRFTAKALEQGPSGGGGGEGAVVNVLPAIGISADRSPGVTLKAFVGETITQSITLYQTNGTTPIVLTGKTLVIVFETRQGLDVATVPNSGITVSGDDDNVVTFNYPAAVTSQERVLKFALRDAGSPNTVYLQGLLSVQRAPKVDV